MLTFIIKPLVVVFSMTYNILNTLNITTNVVSSSSSLVRNVTITFTMLWKSSLRGHSIMKPSLPKNINLSLHQKTKANRQQKWQLTSMGISGTLTSVQTQSVESDAAVPQAGDVCAQPLVLIPQKSTGKSTTPGIRETFPWTECCNLAGIWKILKTCSARVCVVYFDQLSGVCAAKN